MSECLTATKVTAADKYTTYNLFALERDEEIQEGARPVI